MRRIAIGCGLTSLALLIGGTIVGGVMTPGYDHLRQYISELGATGAPTGPWISQAIFIPSGILLVAFWLYCARRLAPGPIAAIGFALLALNGVDLTGGGVYPCDLGCAPDDPSASQRMHNLLSGFGYLMGVVGMFVAAIGLRRAAVPPASMALGQTCAIAGAVFIIGIHPEFALRGAAQRAMEAAFAVWTLACVLALRRQAANRPPLLA